jgi:hypothetical protein
MNTELLSNILLHPTAGNSGSDQTDTILSEDGLATNTAVMPTGRKVQVIGVHAPTVFAEMMDNNPLGDVVQIMSKPVREAMREFVLPPLRVPQEPVPTRLLCLLPVPTACVDCDLIVALPHSNLLTVDDSIHPVNS